MSSQNAPFSIRDASAADAPTLSLTSWTAFEEYRGLLTPPSAAFDETPEIVRRELESEYGAALAEVCDEIAGCVLFRPEGADLYFGRLSVIPKYRGVGQAGALVCSVEAEAVARGCPGVVLGVRIALPDNQRLFQHLGYVRGCPACALWVSRTDVDRDAEEAPPRLIGRTADDAPEGT